MKWLKEKGDFLTLAGLMVALTSLIIASIKDFKADIQQNIVVLRADTQKSIEILQADVREIRTLLITHIVDHHNQSLSASIQKTPRNRKKPRDVSSAPP